MKRLLLLSLMTLCFSTQLAFAEEDEDKTPKSMKEQFQQFKKNANTYKQYFFYEESQLNGFYDAVSDSLNYLKNTIQKQQSKQDSLTKVTETLTKQLADVKAELSETKEKVDGINAFGGTMKKQSFATLMYVLVLIFLLVALLAVFLFLRSNKITKEARNDLDYVKEEFEMFRRTAKDKEMKLNRALQTERNTVEELKNK